MVGDTGARDVHMSISWHTSGASTHIFFEVGAAIVTFMLVGRWREARAQGAGGGAARVVGALAAFVLAVEELSRP